LERSNTGRGWLFGGGIEYGFKPNWTVKLEYDYLELGNWTSATVPAVTLSRDVQMIKLGMNYKFYSGVPVTAGASSSSAGSSGGSIEDLAKASQNPIADLVSVPFQNNTNFHVGPFNRTQDMLNIEPVVPMHLNSQWNLISRSIVPVVSQPNPLVASNTNGIGDVSEELYLSPAHPGALIWGLGPIVTMPSASDPILGTGKVLAGPTIVLLTMPTLGDRDTGQQSVVGRRRSVATVRKHLPRPDLRQLQHERRLVLDLTTHHYRRLDRGTGSAMDRPGRRWLRPCLQSG
jgi:hypothetical protein